VPPTPPLFLLAITSKAADLGFDLCAFAPAHDSVHKSYWRNWIANHHHGDMAYLADRLDERLSPATFLPGARSAICLAINYHYPLQPHIPTPGERPARIARYALPDDYHDWIKTRLYALADYTRELAPGSQTLCGVDTAPIPERELAARAGIGFVGKNTCIIHPRLGSWLFLATILTTLDLPTTDDSTSHCGTCTRCLLACPTGALHPDRPYELNASKCISYLTIEHHGPIPDDLRPGVGNWLYGCDICQDVCPFNTKAPNANLSKNPRLAPRHPTGYVDAAEIPTWTEVQWHPFSRRSAIRRLSLPLLQRNAEVVLANAPNSTTPPPTSEPSSPR